MLSRRNFAKLVATALPAAQLLTPARMVAQMNQNPPPMPKPDSKFFGVQIGVISYSFRGLPAADIIPNMTKIGLSEVELMSNDAEQLAGAPHASMMFGPRSSMTPEQQAAMQKSRDDLNQWRTSTPIDVYGSVRKQFEDAGIKLALLCYNLPPSVTDEEIDYSFRMARALGVGAISSSSTVSVARRVAPFADKYKIMWGGHGHDNVKDPEQFATPETFAKIESFSPYIGVNLDIGHFFAAGFDPVAFIKQNHARITNIHLKDRKRDQPGVSIGQDNYPWGEGATPITQVLLLLKQEQYPFPANIEYEYHGTDPVIEVAKSLQFAKDVLTGKTCA